MAKNAVLPVVRWLRKYGSLLDLRDSLNSGTQQKVLASNYQMTRSQLCTFINNTFDVIYVVKPDIQEALDAMEGERLKRIESAKRDMARIINLATSRPEVKKSAG
jgi:hypothetical protein